MRLCLAAVAGLLLVAAMPVTAQDDSPQYQVAIDQIQSSVRERDGLRGRFVTVQFRLHRSGSAELATDVTDDIVVYEDGRPAAGVEVHRPRSGPLTTVLALDTSGSMNESGKMVQAKKAANTFLDRLHDQADTGLVLFNHDIVPPVVEPARDPQLFAANRERVRGLINGVQARGGTAYIDATARSIELLKGVQGRRAIVVMTDGVDINSKKKLEEVIELARIAEVPVYTLGVGEPGKKEQVSTVLVLDRSNSMLARAVAGDPKTKLQAAQEAASRFVEIMRPEAKATFTAFADVVDKPQPFTNDKQDLKARIHNVKPHLKTLFFEGVYQGVATLVKEDPPGKRAVIALTDGMDTTKDIGLKRMEEAIQLAKKHHIAIYPMGFGPRVNEAAMSRMAKETGGKFFKPQTPQALLEIYENLSIQLHDEGIDEDSLKKLASETGGKYFHARNVEDLKFIYERVAEELQTTYTVTFPSWRQVSDGTVSKVEIVVQRGGKRISNVAEGAHARHGVVAAQMHPGVYLSLLGLVGGGGLVLPLVARRFFMVFQRRQGQTEDLRQPQGASP